MKPKLSQLLNKHSIKDMLSAASVFTSVTGSMIKGDENNVTANPDHIDWEAEKQDILERANWLVKTIVVKDPETLVNKAPSMIGREYQGEWAIYCCSMLSHALANISYLYPDKKEKCPELIAKMIELVNTPIIREYDTMQWKEDAMESLAGPKSHMTYLSILAWMISNYKLAGGDNRYDNLYHVLCDTLVRRMHESKYDLNLLSFPHKQIWLPDMLVTLVALKNYSRFFGDKYADTIAAWVQNARTKWTHKTTGLLAGMLPGESRYQKGMRIRGSHTALICSYLTMVDEQLAREQYEKMCKLMRKEVTFMGKKVCGVQEDLKKSPAFKPAPGDAGLIIKGLSAGGTAFAMGAATYFEDWEFRYQMLRTAEIAGGTKKQKGMRHYNIAELFLVGEATALAMRTNVRR